MRSIRYIALWVAVGLTSVAAHADGLNGYWKNNDQPAWIEIRGAGDAASGVVRRNDANPGAVGRELLKDIAPSPDGTETWRAQIFAARLGDYRDAEISLPQQDQMEVSVSVGMMSRTIRWTRVDDVPQ